MERGKDWHVKLVEEDALLFHVGCGGTVTMRAIPVAAWKAHLAANGDEGDRRSLADIVHDIVGSDGALTMAALSPAPETHTSQ
jgi:hypothetical protein